MRRVITAALILFACVPASSAERPDIFGYFESQSMGAQINEQFYQLLTNKLRVDIQSDIADNVTFGANFDYITYHGKTNWNILDFLTDDVRREAPGGMEPFYTLPFEARNFLDNAYFRVEFERFDLTAGKQQISTGTGWVWNPTDLFNTTDVLDPAYEQPGHNALRVDVPVGSRINIMALYSPEESWRRSAKMARFKFRISRFDMALIGIEKNREYNDFTRFDSTGAGFVEFNEKRQLAGFSTAGELLGFGVWGEYAYSWMEHSDDIVEWVAGIDYTFDFQSYVMAEFYRNSLGKEGPEQYGLNDWMRLLTSQQKSISRDQLYLSVSHPVTDLIEFSLSGIYSISDESAAIVPTVSWSIYQNVDLFAYLNFNLGEDGTAYSEVSGSGGLVRARVYF